MGRLRLARNTVELPDESGQLVQVRDHVTQYLVDHENFTGHAQVLVEKTTNLQTGWDLRTVIYTVGHDVIGQWSQGEIPEPGQVGGGSMDEDGQGSRLFLYDGHGSTRILATATSWPDGYRVPLYQYYAYDAYGVPLGFDPARAATSLLYSGEQFDPRIAMQYLRARYYDPATGRFNRLDPFAGKMQDPQSLHKYLYCHGDGINFNDPGGRFEGLVGLLVACNIQTIVSDLQLQAGQAVMDTVGYTDFYLDPRDYVFARVTSFLASLIPQRVKDAVSNFIADLGWTQIGIVAGVATGATVVLGAAIGIHQQRTSALIRAQQRVASKLDLAERVAEIAETFTEHARKKGTMKWKEALGLARLETYTGRVLREASDEAHDAYDTLLHKIQLKGPLVYSVTKKIRVNEQAIEELYQNVEWHCKYTQGFDTMVVDLLGLSSEQIDRFKSRIDMAKLPRPVMVIF